MGPGNNFLGAAYKRDKGNAKKIATVIWLSAESYLLNIKTFIATPHSSRDLYPTIIEVKDSNAWIVALLLASAFKPTFVITNVRASQLDTVGL
jgi:hypothetical protein